MLKSGMTERRTMDDWLRCDVDGVELETAFSVDVEWSNNIKEYVVARN